MISCRVPKSALIAVALGLAACGGDDDAGPTIPVSAETEATADETVPPADEAPGSTEATADNSGGGSVAVVDQAAVDAAAAAFLELEAAQGVTAFYIAISDPINGEFVSAYGDASVDGPAATVDDNFRIGSISKTVTATVVLQLVDSGDLALDAVVGDLLPDLAAEQAGIAEVTVEQLLNMASGIPDYLNMNDAVVPLVVEDPSTVWAPEELIEAGVGAGIDETRAPSYSTTNFIILQLIAESVTGSPLQDLITEQVTGPLGLDGLYLPRNEDTTLPDPATHGYIDGACIDEVVEDGATVEPGTDTTEWNASYGQGGGGMTSTIADLLGWAASGSGNSLLDPATAELRVGSVQALAEGIPYGLGIMPLGPWIGHEGEAIGWEALALINVETGVSVAVAGNGCGGLFAGFLGLLGTLYPDSAL